VKWGPLVIGELSDKELLRDTLHKFGIQAVLHFAPHAYVGESILEPQKYFQNNVANSLALLEAMLDSGVKTLVFSSTCATYGIPNALPIAVRGAKGRANPRADLQ